MRKQVLKNDVTSGKVYFRHVSYYRLTDKDTKYIINVW